MENTCLIKKNEEFGRYVVAAKTIDVGETLFEELPFAYGPKADSPVVCLGCYRILNGIAKEGERCAKCGWPLCSNCKDISVHKNECDVFLENAVQFQNSDKITERCSQLDCITPLRVLRAKEDKPDRWKQEIEIMEDHETARKDSETWKNDDNNIVKYLQGPCGLKDRFPSDLIQKVIGILEVNAFEAKTTDGNNLRCLYPKLAILAHSCAPNTTHNTFPSQDFKVTVRATIDVPKGEMLNSCYTHTLEGTTARQHHLKHGKYFICRCNRCLDSTELGSHFSSFKCSKCDSGLIVSSDPLNVNSAWNCTQCLFSTSGAAIAKAVSIMQTEIKQVFTQFELGPERLQMCEQLYSKYKRILHPLHFIKTALRQNLIELYGRVKGYEMNKMPNVLLERKIMMIRDVLKVLQIVEPGKTRMRAQMLFELHVPLLYIMKVGFASGTISRTELEKSINEILSCLDECAAILEWDDPITPEGMLCQVAKIARQQLNASLLTLPSS